MQCITPAVNRFRLLNLHRTTRKGLSVENSDAQPYKMFLSMYLRVTHGCGCSILAPNAEASYCTFLNPCPEQSARATNHLSKALHSFASVQVWLGRSLGQWPTRADLFPHQCPYPEDSCVKSAARLNLVVGLLLKHGMRPQMSSRD